MPLPPPPAGLLAQIQSKSASGDVAASVAGIDGAGAGAGAGGGRRPRTTNGVGGDGDAAPPPPPASLRTPKDPSAATAPDSADAADATDGRPFAYDPSLASFTFDLSPPSLAPRRSSDAFGNDDVDVVVPLAPCAYRMTDHTLAKKEPLSLSRCVDKLGVLRCLAKERDNLNDLLRARLGDEGGGGGTMEESELGKCRFLELISNCGVCQEVSEMILKRCHEASDGAAESSDGDGASGVDAGSDEGAGGNPGS